MYILKGNGRILSGSLISAMKSLQILVAIIWKIKKETVLYNFWHILHLANFKIGFGNTFLETILLWIGWWSLHQKTTSPQSLNLPAPTILLNP